MNVAIWSVSNRMQLMLVKWRGIFNRKTVNGTMEECRCRWHYRCTRVLCGTRPLLWYIRWCGFNASAFACLVLHSHFASRVVWMSCQHSQNMPMQTYSVSFAILARLYLMPWCIWMPPHATCEYMLYVLGMSIRFESKPHTALSHTHTHIPTSPGYSAVIWIYIIFEFTIGSAYSISKHWLQATTFTNRSVQSDICSCVWSSGGCGLRHRCRKCLRMGIFYRIEHRCSNVDSPVVGQVKTTFAASNICTEQRDWL